MSKDLRRILEGWEYDPEAVTVRIVDGEDGREKVQLRLDLGLLQMEVAGRPDGQKPGGCDSWLEFYEQREQQTREEESAFELDAEDCGHLMREGVQYYHRYLSFWHLKRYDLCVRDTQRNLRLFRFVRQFARHERDKLQFDQFRPYVTMMHTRALATPLVETQHYDDALRAIDAGIHGVWTFLEDYGQTKRADQCGELVELKRWRKEVSRQSDAAANGDQPEGDEGEFVPLLDEEQATVDSTGMLRERLHEAIAHERFEEAAQLRDQLRRITEAPDQPPPRHDPSGDAS